MKQEDVLDLLRRRLDGKSQAALAREMGVSPQYLWDVLNGRREPGPSILEYLGVEKRETFVRK